MPFVQHPAKWEAGIGCVPSKEKRTERDSALVPHRGAAPGTVGPQTGTAYGRVGPTRRGAQMRVGPCKGHRAKPVPRRSTAKARQGGLPGGQALEMTPFDNSSGNKYSAKEEKLECEDSWAPPLVTGWGHGRTEQDHIFPVRNYSWL